MTMNNKHKATKKMWCDRCARQTLHRYVEGTDGMYLCMNRHRLGRRRWQVREEPKGSTDE